MPHWQSKPKKYNLTSETAIKDRCKNRKSTKKDLPITYTDYLFQLHILLSQSHSRLRWSLILWCVTVDTSRGKPSGCLDITLPKISWPQFCTWQAISMTKLLNTRQTEQGYMEATNRLQWRRATLHAKTNMLNISFSWSHFTPTQTKSQWMSSVFHLIVQYKTKVRGPIH